MAAHSPSPGKPVLVDYDVLRPLGEGGMGRVYLARHRETGRQVVVKVMHDQLASDDKTRQQFRREAELMMRFHHPYAVALLACPESEPPCLVMEHVAGLNLDQLLARVRRFSPERTGAVLGKLCV